MEKIIIGTKVQGKDFNGDIHEGVISKIKNQELGWDEQGFEVDKLKFHIAGVDGVRFNYEDLTILERV